MGMVNGQCSSIDLNGELPGVETSAIPSDFYCRTGNHQRTGNRMIEFELERVLQYFLS